MDSKFFEELVGREVEITVFDGFPTKCRIIESDGDFLKVEEKSRKVTRKVLYINKNLISQIEES